jgi:hypothetical protein
VAQCAVVSLRDAGGDYPVGARFAAGGTASRADQTRFQGVEAGDGA